MNDIQFTEKQLEDFKELYYKKFWEKLSNQEALEKWLKLVTLVKNVYIDKEDNN